MMFKKAGFLLAALASLSLVVLSLSCEWIKPTSHLMTCTRPLELRLEKAPRLNEPVKLTCVCCVDIDSMLMRMSNLRTTSGTANEEINIITVVREDLKTSRMEWKVPLSDILVEGSLNWKADITIDKSQNRIQVSPQDVLAEHDLDIETATNSSVPLEFSAIIKFPKEGNWGIAARSKNSYSGDITYDDFFLNITQDRGSFDWVQSYAPYGGCYPDGEPDLVKCITTQLDIVKPPALNKPAQLRWSLDSIKDVSGVTGEVSFKWMKGTTGIEMLAQDVLVDGNLSWYGSLIKDSPLDFSAVVKFPYEGDWEVHAKSSYYLTNGMPRESGCVLYLHIDEKESSWGWTEPHERKYSGVPPHPLPDTSQ
jgi:hypothetical protein